MSFFSKKPQSYLGVDIGAGGIKVVEFRDDKHRARLSTYGFAEVVTSLSASAPEAHPSGAGNLGTDLEAVAGTLREVCARAKVESNRVVTSLPIAAVFSSIVSLPHMPKKELGSAVTWEAKKLVPLPIEDMIIDWKLLSPEGELESKEATAKPVRVLLTGAPKNLVQQYITVFKSAKLELISLETEAFALIRSLVGDDPSVVCILDIGAARTSMVIVDAGTPVFSRSIDVGGQDVTRAIGAAMGTDEAQAEQLKLDMAVMPTNPAAAGLTSMLASAFATVIQEVRYGMNLYLSQEEHRGRVVEKVILAGGTAMLPTLTDFLSKELNLRVFVGDPWARVIYPIDLRPALDAVGPQFAVAIGLAMREMA
ncbi:MAG: type IV pilus assembly protein PilM [bacterium]|nr:type IV pilus assembly protein PilM [bacterium]